jgi:hypothetical protein
MFFSRPKRSAMTVRQLAQLHVILFDVSEHYLPDDRNFAPLLRLWQSCCRDGSLPDRTMLGFETLRPWLGSIAILRQEDHGEDFVYRLFGRKLSEDYNFDMTGQRMSELPYGLSSVLLAATTAAVEKQIPVFVVYQPGDGYLFGERADLILPFDTSGDVMIASYPMAFSAMPSERRTQRVIADA